MSVGIFGRARDVPPATRHRISRNIAPEINARIADGIAASVRRHARQPSRIDRRLADLDHEWDMERSLEAHAAALSLAGLALGAWVDRRFLAIPATVSGFLLMHALQGWCPPVSLLRRRGFRTSTEIETERTALRIVRGDLDAPPSRAEGDSRALARAALRAAWR